MDSQREQDPLARTDRYGGLLQKHGERVTLGDGWIEFALGDYSETEKRLYGRTFSANLNDEQDPYETIFKLLDIR